MSTKLYGKEDGQEYEVQGFVYGGKDSAEAIVVNTKTKRIFSMSLGGLDSLKPDARADLEKKMNEEVMEKMKADASKLQPANGQSGMSQRQAEEHSRKTGVNSQGQTLIVDKDTGKVSVDPQDESLGNIESSENPSGEKDESLLDKAKHAFSSKK